MEPSSSVKYWLDMRGQIQYSVMDPVYNGVTAVITESIHNNLYLRMHAVVYRIVSGSDSEDRWQEWSVYAEL